MRPEPDSEQLQPARHEPRLLPEATPPAGARPTPHMTRGHCSLPAPSPASKPRPLLKGLGLHPRPRPAAARDLTGCAQSPSSGRSAHRPLFEPPGSPNWPRSRPCCQWFVTSRTSSLVPLY